MAKGVEEFRGHVTVATAAKRSGISSCTIRRRIRRGAIAACAMGGSLVLSADVVEELRLERRQRDEGIRQPRLLAA